MTSSPGRRRDPTAPSLRILTALAMIRRGRDLADVAATTHVPVALLELALEDRSTTHQLSGPT